MFKAFLEIGMTFTRIVTTAVFAAGLMLAAGAVQAQRKVFVNGRLMNPQQLLVLDRMQCTFIPSGSYWLDAATGAWGYAGNPRRQGFVGDLCRTGGQSHRSLSERGLLYTPGDLTFR
ncbi:hypothetical protein HLB44_15260 [Aquincola sp. S2]|uniref:Uncharacterized protein n=1 Tax=Pseudaquabacterium terrae TaxID=2732868 RepID=A0ABX2EIF4_9BURK|nr:hypothetical protein [Aquabacterium terrae]NRF68351.1 hypothetical protein [Aquabacterium terrae]